MMIDDFMRLENKLKSKSYMQMYDDLEDDE